MNGRRDREQDKPRGGRPRALLIAGPTASGKSALALRLAEQHRGVIVNADSMQVYRELRIITARPTKAEAAQVPHRLYGHVDAAENYSAGRWCRDAVATLAEAEAAGRVPIFVGGTGLYFKALTTGLAAVPPIPTDIRARIRDRLEREGAPALHAELMRRDPQTASRLMTGDRARITRALEVIEATGRSISDWHRDGMPAALDPADAVKLFLTIDRPELHRRIAERFEAMLAAGALDEVAKLAARGLDPSLPAMKAHGVPWLIRHLAGEIGLAEAVEGAIRDTRRYTKRQATWFRNQMPGWLWLGAAEAEHAVDEALRMP